jgi:hypothetical protein
VINTELFTINNADDCETKCVGEHAWCVCILKSQTEICVPTHPCDVQHLYVMSEWRALTKTHNKPDLSILNIPTTSITLYNNDNIIL